MKVGTISKQVFFQLSNSFIFTSSIVWKILVGSNIGVSMLIYPLIYMSSVTDELMIPIIRCSLCGIVITN